MKNNKHCAQRPQVGPHLRASRNGLRVVIGLLALTVGLGSALTPLRVGAIPYTASAATPVSHPGVYLYDGNGDPVLDPDATILDGGVYTDSGFVGTINADDYIVNTDSVIVGFVDY